jgi:hypothetical protein
MPEFKCFVRRIGYSSREITVQAANERDAYNKLVDVAGSYEFSESDSEYEINEDEIRKVIKLNTDTGD